MVAIKTALPTAVLCAAALATAGCTGSASAPSAHTSTSGHPASGPAPSPTAPTSTAPSSTAPSSTASSSGRSGQQHGGTIKQAVAPVVATTAPAVGLGTTATMSGHAGKVVVSLARISSKRVSASGPGEIAGPALVVTVHVANNSARSVDVAAAAVTVLDSARQVATPTPAAPAAPFTGRLAPGASADGVYVFTLAPSARKHINVFVSYSAGAPVAHFTGNAA